MRVSEDRYMRDLRRIHLAQRLIRHEARTRTICAWTGLNGERVRNLAKSYEATLNAARRHRGPSPRKMDMFLRQTLARSEASCLAGLARLFGIVPATRIADARRSIPGIVMGERLCHTFELYRQVVPEARFTMEHFILVVMGVAEGNDVVLEHCTRCDAALLTEPGSRERTICFSCNVLEAKPAPAMSTHNPDAERIEPLPAVGAQRPLF